VIRRGTIPFGRNSDYVQLVCIIDAFVRESIAIGGDSGKETDLANPYNILFTDLA
jgi:hypothetical protein